MFEVVLCKEQLPLPYHHMTYDSNGRMTVKPQVLCDIITHQYNDRVKPNIGLFIDLYDIVKATECKSIPDINVAYVTVFFSRRSSNHWFLFTTVANINKNKVKIVMFTFISAT